ncbi:hypothetical protein QQZ08_004515 [Neonectria magnoliae]|uniref:Pinin/SDK/MemA protein domain-containing protein n=1 Tax=Neonectria magnoliae TaxID=2732573 RepID=A0ABR1I6D6_9HYPO
MSGSKQTSNQERPQKRRLTALERKFGPHRHQKPSSQTVPVANQDIQTTALEKKPEPPKRQQTSKPAVTVASQGTRKPTALEWKLGPQKRPQTSTQPPIVANQTSRKRSASQEDDGHSNKKPRTSQSSSDDRLNDLQKSIRKKLRALDEHHMESQRLKRVQKGVGKLQGFFAAMVAGTTDSHEQELYRKVMNVAKSSADKFIGQEAQRVERAKKEVRREIDSLRQTKLQLGSA